MASKKKGEKGFINISLSRIAEIIAKLRFDSGPAREMSAASRLGFLRLYGSNLTGLAQPKTIGDFRKISRSGNKIVPYKSICAKGFREILPMSLGVGSPSLSAVQA